MPGPVASAVRPPLARLAPVTRVDAIIFHPAPAAGAGLLTAAFATVRRWNADRQAAGFERAGAQARVVEGADEGGTFGRRVREALGGSRPDGVVLLGSGSIPLATAADRRAFVATAAGPAGHGLSAPAPGRETHRGNAGG